MIFLEKKWVFDMENEVKSVKLKDNKIFRWIVIPICIALCMFTRFIPSFGGLSQDAIGVLGIFLGSIILWLTIGIDWPSLITIFSLGFLTNMGFSKALSNSFGNATFVFLLFTFICTYALSKTSLIKRIAIAFVNNKLAKKSGKGFVCLFLLAVLILGLFISPSVLFVIILPILDEIFELAKIEKGDKVAKVLLMGLGFTVSISSGMTPIAHVFPVLAMNAAGVEVSAAVYMGFAIPAGLLLFGLMLLIFLFIVRPDVSKLKDVDVSSIQKDLPPIDKKDIITVIIFGVVILLWVIPSFFKNASPDFYNAINQYGTAMPPLLGTILLCVIRVKDKPLVEPIDALKNGVPWAALLMCAATLVLGVAMTDNNIGLSAWLQERLGGSLKGLPAFLLLFIFALWAALQTNVSSNMVTATLVATVAAAIIRSTGVGLNVAAVACIIGMLASFAFATPPSMPHIAIVAGSDYCSTKDVLIYGSLLMLASVLVALAAYPLANLMM